MLINKWFKFFSLHFCVKVYSLWSVSNTDDVELSCYWKGHCADNEPMLVDVTSSSSALLRHHLHFHQHIFIEVGPIMFSISWTITGLLEVKSHYGNDSVVWRAVLNVNYIEMVWNGFCLISADWLLMSTAESKSTHRMFTGCRPTVIEILQYKYNSCSI